MNKRSELTLGSLLALTVLGVGILSWGQLSGRLPIISQSLFSSADVAPRPTAQPTAPNSFREDFGTSHQLDTVATTADWNTEAHELVLKPATTEGLGQSLKFADLTSNLVQVTLTGVVDQPVGSEMYYALSGDGGKTWSPVMAGQPQTMVGSGDWRWRVLLKRGFASYSPSIQKLTIQFVPSRQK